MSLRRTGRATLMASGSTGQHHCGVVNSAPLVEVVNLDLPGGAAHLSNVSNAPRL